MKKAIWFIVFGVVIIGITLWGGTKNPSIFVFTLLGFISLFVGIFKIFGVKSKSANNAGEE